MPVTILLKAIGMTPEAILAAFYDFDTFQLAKTATSRTGARALRAKSRVSTSSTRRARRSCRRTKRITGKHIRDMEARGNEADGRTGRVPDGAYARAQRHQQGLRRDTRQRQRRNHRAPACEVERGGHRDIKTVTPTTRPRRVHSQTLKIDETADQSAARVAIYRMMRPGEPPTEDAVETLFNGLFYSEDRYDLSAVGRMKFNRRAYPEKSRKGPAWLRRFYARVGPQGAEGLGRCRTTISSPWWEFSLELRNGRGEIDDIDHLGNRRVRSVGELAENQFRAGLVRVERAVKERLSQAESENLMPHDLINAKPISARSRSFSARASCRSSWTRRTRSRKSRTSGAYRPGPGASPGAPGFECATCTRLTTAASARSRTPEGPNIGLINSLALYARTNRYGFLETPSQKVVNEKSQNEIDFLSAIEKATSSLRSECANRQER